MPNQTTSPQLLFDNQEVIFQNDLMTPTSKESIFTLK